MNYNWKTSFKKIAAEITTVEANYPSLDLSIALDKSVDRFLLWTLDQVRFIELNSFFVILCTPKYHARPNYKYFFK